MTEQKNEENDNPGYARLMAEFERRKTARAEGKPVFDSDKKKNKPTLTSIATAAVGATAAAIVAPQLTQAADIGVQLINIKPGESAVQFGNDSDQLVNPASGEKVPSTDGGGPVEHHPIPVKGGEGILEKIKDQLPGYYARLDTVFGAGKYRTLAFKNIVAGLGDKDLVLLNGENNIDIGVKQTPNPDGSFRLTAVDNGLVLGDVFVDSANPEKSYSTLKSIYIPFGKGAALHKSDGTWTALITIPIELGNVLADGVTYEATGYLIQGGKSVSVSGTLFTGTPEQPAGLIVRGSESAEKTPETNLGQPVVAPENKSVKKIDKLPAGVPGRFKNTYVGQDETNSTYHLYLIKTNKEVAILDEFKGKPVWRIDSFPESDRAYTLDEVTDHIHSIVKDLSPDEVDLITQSVNEMINGLNSKGPEGQQLAQSVLYGLNGLDEISPSSLNHVEDRGNKVFLPGVELLREEDPQTHKIWRLEHAKKILGLEFAHESLHPHIRQLFDLNGKNVDDETIAFTIMVKIAKLLDYETRIIDYYQEIIDTKGFISLNP